MSGTTTAVKAASRLRIFSAIESDYEPVTLRLFAAGSDSPPRIKRGNLRCTTEHEFSSPLRRAIAGARLHLTQWQQADGSYRGARPADPDAVSHFILLAAWFDPLATDEAQRAVRVLTNAQLADGAWPRRHGGPGDASTTILAYLALKLAGCASRERVMQAARRYIWNRGGAAAGDARVRMFLALFGQIPFEHCRIAPFHARDANGTIQRAAFRLLKLLRPQAACCRPGLVRELFKTAPDAWSRSWTSALAERALSACTRVAQKRLRLPMSKPLQRLAETAHELRTRRLRARLVRQLRAARPIGNHLDGLNGDATVWTSIALSCDSAGPTSKHKATRRRICRRLADRDPDDFRVNVRPHGVADTAMAVAALSRSGLTVRSAAVRSAVQFLVQTPSTSTEDAAWTLRGLNAALSTGGGDAKRLPPEVQIRSNDMEQHASGRTSAALLTSALDLQQQLKTRLLESQLRDGGWTTTPLAGSRAWWRAKSQVGLTALVLQALAESGYQRGSPTVDRAIGFLKGVQCADGRFADADGMSAHMLSSSTAVQTTSNVLAALIAVGVPSNDVTCQAATDWLVAHEQPEGGWGETPEHDPEYVPGEGPVSIVDTAAAVECLVAAGLAGLEAVGSGVDLLLDANPQSKLPARCAALLALCCWAADENNKERTARHVPLPPLRVAKFADIPA